MGLLKHLLFWPVTGPLFLTDFALGKVRGVVRDELTDESSVKAELLELQLRLELGEVDDESYVAQEAALLRRLREVREWRERFGMSVTGGPVRMAPSTGEPAGEAAPEAAAGPSGEAAPGVSDPSSVSIEINLDWE